MASHHTHSAPIAPLSNAEREAQRVAHLVMGAPRPPIAMPAKPKGISKQEWKAQKARARATPVELAPGIEEVVQRREAWRGRNGTPETLARADAERRREGALLRLVRTGTLDAHQLAAAEDIQLAHHALTADVRVRTAKLEPRGTGGGPDAAEAERIAAVIRERAYRDWSAAMGAHAAMLLAIVVDDLPLTIAARRWRLSNRRARSILVAALDRWRRL